MHGQGKGKGKGDVDVDGEGEGYGECSYKPVFTWGQPVPVQLSGQFEPCLIWGTGQKHWSLSLSLSLSPLLSARDAESAQSGKIARSRNGRRGRGTDAACAVAGAEGNEKKWN